MKLHITLAQGPYQSSLCHSNFSICAAKQALLTHFSIYHIGDFSTCAYVSCYWAAVLVMHL